MRKKKTSLCATPRGSCPVCNYRFADATDDEFRHRWAYHLNYSERHKKYLALQNTQPPGPTLAGEMVRLPCR
jgi:hypothetical protein